MSRWSSTDQRSSLVRGLAFTYVGFLLLLPLAALILKAAETPPAALWELLTQPMAIASYQLTFGMALLAAAINSVFGFILAWILVRYDFPGRRLADGVIDLPFAMPSVVAGIGLMSLYSPVGAFGRWLRPDTPLGGFLAQFGAENVNLTSSVFGILLANLFVTLPFVVRSVQPAILAIEADVIEAAQTLGSLRWQTFRRIILPPLVPAIATGFTLAFARCVGEYGVVTLISGNIPFRTMISSVYIFRRLEAFDLSGATAVALLLLIFALAIIAAVNTVQWWSQRKQTA